MRERRDQPDLTPHDALAAADDAMYDAKNAGKHGYAINATGGRPAAALPV